MTAVLAEPARLPREVPDWHETGRCRQFPELSWVHPGAADAFDKPTRADREVAEYACRIVCSTCPVRLACAVGALERREPYGIWGGLDRADRTKVARRYGYPIPGDPPPHGTNSRRVKWGCDCRECKDAHALYEAQRRERKRAAPSAFVRRVRELHVTRGWSYPDLAARTGADAGKVRSVAIGETRPDMDTVTALARAYADDPADRARLAEELHQLAGTAAAFTRVGDRRVMVMAGSRHDAEVRHVRALPANVCTGETVQIRPRLDLSSVRRRTVARARRRRR